MFVIEFANSVQTGSGDKFRYTCFQLKLKVLSDVIKWDAGLDN